MLSLCSRIVASVVFIVLISTNVFAQTTVSGGSGFSFIGGVAVGPGTAKSESSIESRKMLITDLHALIGWKFSGLTIGAMGQYLLAEQTTEPSSVGNTNLASKGYLLGLGLGYTYGPVLFQLSYDMMGNQELKKKTAGGYVQEFEKPSGFTVILGYHLTPMVTVDLMYNTHSYKETSIGGVSGSISSDKFTQSFFGLGLGFVY